MIRSVMEMHNFELVAPDGRIGTVDDCYCDEDRWAIRYVVVDAVPWLMRHDVLISPLSVRRIEWGERRLPPWSTGDQIKHSPGIDTHQSVSRRHEMEYLDYYGYPYYCDHPGLWGTHALPVRPGSDQIALQRKMAVIPQLRAGDRGDTRLRRTSEVVGYVIRPTDAEVGSVEDCLFDDVSWAVEYLVVNAGNRWRGEKTCSLRAWLTKITSCDGSVDALISRRRG